MQETTTFRAKSLERINSPENLEDYIRIANPSVWVILAAVVILLLGLGLWGVFGRIETKVPVQIVVEESNAICVADPAELAAVENGMVLRIGTEEGTVSEVDLQSGMAKGNISVSDGNYEGFIVIESLMPMSFIFN